jgi:hypothetical protein
MWLELTREPGNETVWVNTELVGYMVEMAGAGSRLFFPGGLELAVKESLDRIMERMQLA